jgi:S1-C subfamily serine protease
MDLKSKWLLGVGIALGTIGLLVAGGFAGVAIYKQIQPEPSPIDVFTSRHVERIDEGVLVLKVEPGSPAEEAGMVRGDVLLRINGEEVSSSSDARAVLEGLGAGDEVRFDVLHAGAEQELTLELEAAIAETPLGLTLCCDPTGPALRTRLMFEGEQLVVTQVLPDSPADKAGLVSGDVSLEVEGVEIDSADALADAMADYEPGDQIRLTVLRRGSVQPEELEVTLGEHPDEPDRAYLGVRYRYGQLPGLQFVAPGARGRFLLPGPDVREMLERFEELKDKLQFLPECGEHVDEEGEMVSICGLIVAQVENDSPAEEAGIQIGDLILALDGETIRTQAAFVDAVRARQPGDEIELTIFHPGDEAELELVVTLGEHPEDEGVAFLGVTVPGFFYHAAPGMWPHYEGQGPSFQFKLPHFDFSTPPDTKPSGPARLQFEA